MNEIFIKILEMSISASILVLAVLLLRLFTKKAPKWINVLLWGIVAIRLVLPFSFECPASLVPQKVGSGELVSEWRDEYIGDYTVIYEDSEYYAPAITAGRAPVKSESGTYYVVTKYDQLGEPDTNGNAVVPILSLVWIFGMVLMALYTFVSYFILKRKIGTAVPIGKNIYQSENVKSPFVLGIIRPKIYLSFSTNENEIEYVTAHEAAHIARKDHLWKPLGFLLLTIYWFNPLLWLAYVLLCRDIEFACDEKVIKKLPNNERADYTQALLSCSVNRRMIAACPIAFGEVGVKERVKSVMDYKKPAFWIIIVAVLAIITVCVCFLTNPKQEEHEEKNTEEQLEENEEEIEDEIIIEIPTLEDAALSGDYAFNRKFKDNLDLSYTIILSEIVGEEELNIWIDSKYMIRPAEQRDKYPAVYQMILDLKIPREQFESVNEKHKGEAQYYSQEIIDALYNSDRNEMIRLLKNGNALYYDGEIYTLESLSKTPAPHIPEEVMNEYFYFLTSILEQRETLNEEKKMLKRAEILYEGIDITLSNELQVIYDGTHSSHEPVLKYAKEIVSRQIDSHNDLGQRYDYYVTSAVLTALEEINTGTSGLTSGHKLYRVEYLIGVNKPENVVTMFGTKMEDGKITEWSTDGQPYLIMHWDAETDPESVPEWSLICETETINIEHYSTPKMIDKYGDMYTAATIELYAIHKRDEARRRAEEIAESFTREMKSEVYSIDEMQLRLTDRIKNEDSVRFDFDITVHYSYKAKTMSDLDYVKGMASVFGIPEEGNEPLVDRIMKKFEGYNEDFVYGLDYKFFELESYFVDLGDSGYNFVVIVPEKDGTLDFDNAELFTKDSVTGELYDTKYMKSTAADARKSGEHFAKNMIESYGIVILQESDYVSDLVSSSEYKIGLFSDGREWVLNYKLRLPQISFEKSVDKKVNGRINELFYSPAQQLIQEKNSTFECNYQLYENDDYISILTVHREGNDVKGHTVAYTVIIDKKAEKIMTLNQMLEKFKISSLPHSFDVQKDLFYLNSHGELCIIYKAYPPIASEEGVYRVQNLSKNSFESTLYVPEFNTSSDSKETIREIQETIAIIPTLDSSLLSKDMYLERKFKDNLYDIYKIYYIVDDEIIDDYIENVYYKMSEEEMEALPTIYQFIKHFDISREDFEDANENAPYGTTLDEEIIDILYCGNEATIKRLLKNGNALYYNGEIYTFRGLCEKVVTEIPEKVLRKYFSFIDDYYRMHGNEKYDKERVDNARELYGLNYPEHDIMPYPFKFVYGTGNVANSMFYLPCVEDRVFEGVASFSAVSNEDVEKWIDDLRSTEKAPSNLKEFVNMYSFIEYFGISNEEAYAEYEKYLYPIAGTPLMTQEELDTILSRDEEAIIEMFKSDYAIVIGTNIYTPEWMYQNSLETWQSAGITPEMVKEKISLYKNIGFTLLAKDAFENKLAKFIGEKVSL